MISRGRSLIGRVGCSIHAFHSRTLVPEPRHFGYDCKVAFCTSLGFPINLNNILVSTLYFGKVVDFWHLIQTSIFQKELLDLDSFCVFTVSHCTCEIKFRTTGV